MQAQIIQQAIQQNIVSAAQEVESQLDDQIHALEKLGSEDIEVLRQKRVLQLKLYAKKKQEWLRRGHGEYTEVLSEKGFFEEMKGEERMVCHFYRENWPCKVMDKHLRSLATSHLETKFIKIDAEKAPFLVERLKIWMLPTLALVKRQKTVDYVVGFDDLGGKDDFTTEMLAERLRRSGLLHQDSEPARSVSQNAPAVRQSAHSRPVDSDEDSDFE